MAGDGTSWRRRLLSGVRSLGVTYALLCLVMFLAQGFLLFHPTSIPDEEFERLEAMDDVEALSIDVDGATLQGFFLHGRGDGPRPTVLYFGGNAQSVWRQVTAKRWAAAMGFNVAFVSYRGYDRSSGSASSDALTQDALRIYDVLVQRPDVSVDRIVTWGFSLGTGVATHVACNRAVAGVVLMAPYDTLASVAAAQYPFLPVRPLFSPPDRLARLRGQGGCARPHPSWAGRHDHRPRARQSVGRCLGRRGQVGAA